MRNRKPCDEYISITKVCLRMDINPMTIRRWYLWYENPKFEKPEELKLPKYYYKDRRGTKYFRVADIPILEEFRDLIRTKYKGAMKDFTWVYSGGKVGRQRLGDRYREIRRRLYNR